MTPLFIFTMWMLCSVPIMIHEAKSKWKRRPLTTDPNSDWSTFGVEFMLTQAFILIFGPFFTLAGLIGIAFRSIAKWTR